MGMEPLKKPQKFGLEELGLLSDLPLESFDIVVDLCAEAVAAQTVAFTVFDVVAGSVVIRSIVGHASVRLGPVDMPANDTLAWLVREKSAPISFSNLDLRCDTHRSMERTRLDARAYLGAPVFGPDGKIVGVLAAMTRGEHYWTLRQKSVVGSFASLMSDQIMLRAALQTVKLIANERAAVGNFVTRWN